MSFFGVTMPPAVGPTLLPQMDMGSLTCARFGACSTHELTDVVMNFMKRGGGGQVQTDSCEK